MVSETAADQGHAGGTIQAWCGCVQDWKRSNSRRCRSSEVVPESSTSGSCWRAMQSWVRCIVSGRGVTQNDGEAVKWYQKAADQGYAECTSQPWSDV